ncbi:MFS transporter [Pseudoroseomonas wenyumeiae]|uniref:MFS transporter n=1 Tax=Teichococcus wenyumeiae TaxID=2478470 RepID=A0A3A9JLF0_9PROT|nr:MFS transporter [Pseudoroseomonas wenyumeiae]RKK04636.1 MFS transporter [Pseudoroseomonas wenyumeiae]RMI19302.1 MFS transporter [Pseudoroseomonas wenyumeiae]
MIVVRRAPARSPFAIRSYRFQWSADLMTSWAFEMETLILGWYIVVQTNSVLLVTLFGSLQFLGTLIAPFFGLAGDAFGHRNVMCLMRAAYALLAAFLAALVLTDLLTPVLALVVAGIAGLIRPSDMGIRNVLIGETMPEDRLTSAIGLSRITSDSARVCGALAGASIVAILGMGQAYLMVVVFYVLGMLLTLGVDATRAADRETMGAAPSPLRGLWEAAQAVWQAPPQLAAMLMAFLINLTAYPFTLGLLPYVAQDVYGTTQAGLGYLIAAVAGGGIVASLIVSRMGRAAQPARMMLVFSIAWHGLVILFGQINSLPGGLLLLPLIGITQMLCLLPMSVLLLRGAPPALRGRIMGMRTLAVYGLPVGLLCSGPLIDHLGFPATTAIYGTIGIVATLLVLGVWRSHLWPKSAPGNIG